MLNLDRFNIYYSGVALGLVGLALLIMQLLDPWLNMSTSPFLVFFVAIMLSARYGGFRCGLLATIFSAFVSTYAFVSPKYSFVIGFSDSIRTLIFILEGGFVSWLFHSLQTTKRQAEKSLKELSTNKERYQRIVETAQEGIWVIDAKGVTEYVNDRMCEMLGYPKEEVWGSSLFDFMEESKYQEVEKNLEKRRQGLSDRYDFCFRRKDGSELWTLISTNPILGDAGEYLGVLKMITDITERKHIQEELYLITDAIPALIAYVDADQHYRFSNKTYESWLGKSPIDIKGKPVKEVIGDATYDRIVPNIEQVLSGEQVIFESYLPCLDKDYRDVSISLVPRFNSQGQVQGYISLIYDISDLVEHINERRILENDLLKREARLRRIFDSSLLGIVFADFDGRILEANASFLEIIGYTEEDVLDGQVKWTSLTPTEYVGLDAKAVKEVRHSGSCSTYEKEYIRKDGTRVPILIGAALLPDNSEKCVCYIIDLTERKRTELALQEANQRAINILESITNGFVSCDKEWRYTYINNSAERLLDKSREELMGQIVWEVFPDSVDSSFYRSCIQAVNEQVTYMVEDFEPSLKVWTKAYFYPSGDGLSIFFEDVTSRKMAEIALQESEERLRLSQRAAKSGSWDWNLVTNKVLWSEECFLVLGLRPNSVESSVENWLASIHPDDRESSNQLLKEAIALHQEVNIEFRIFYENGELHWINSKGRVIYDDDGKPLRVLGIVIDITDRKWAELALSESEERFRLMADASPVLIWLAGLDKLCFFFNKTWLEFTGRSMAEEMGNGWTEGVHPDDFQYCLDTYINAFDTHEKFEMEYRLRRFDGEYCWFLDIGLPRFASNGDFIGYIGSCVDISDRKQAEIQMRQFNELLEQRVKERTAQLERANQELEAFSYSVSHDLRAPIRHISGFVSMLQKQAHEKLDATGLRYLQIIQDTTKQSGLLIDDLLAFSRMGRSEMRSRVVDMNQLVYEVKGEIEARSDRINTSRKIHWQINLLPEVQGDPAMLRLVIRNLLDNAVKYTKNKLESQIKVDSFTSDREYIFSVQDNGTGFDMEYVHKLFGVFQRLHNDLQFEGTGIGLANVRRIIHRHGGRTWAEGQIGEGATFFFSLPISPKIEILN